MTGTFLQESGIREWTEERRLFGDDHPITFERFLDITGDKDFVELVDGMLVEKMAAQLDHEWSIAWLNRVLGVICSKHGLGIVIGSRTAVEITEFGGRLPDILFVRESRREIVQERAVYGAPDLVIEFRSPGDRPSDMIALEADYRQTGVTEIAFVDRQNGVITLFRKRNGAHETSAITPGGFAFEALPQIRLQAEWLLTNTRPEVYDLITEILNAIIGTP
ncbi:MAG TPA: Uma2 family endonuclease [Chthonomonadaceae bacterium]|nr:Uma2 family endonuclease [Chthonomonadaceae bacterium]